MPAEFALICDIGGVLVDLNVNPIPESFVAYLGAVAKAEASHGRRGLRRCLQNGQLDFSSYVDLLQTVAPTLTADRVRAHENSLLGPVIAERLAMLDAASDRVCLVTLSNTHIVHWEELRRREGLLDRFAYHFPSFETGTMKPAKGAFEHVLGQARFRREHCMFLDDLRENVSAARAVGIRALRVTQSPRWQARLLRWLKRASIRPAKVVPTPRAVTN